MSSVLVVNVGRDSGRETLRQPTWEEMERLIAALGTVDVFELQLERSIYLPEQNSRDQGPQMTILGENGQYHVHVWHLEELFCYCGGDPRAEGEHFFAKADQGCGEMGLTFPVAQLVSDKGVVREIALRYWTTGEWRDDERWRRAE